MRTKQGIQNTIIGIITTEADAIVAAERIVEFLLEEDNLSLKPIPELMESFKEDNLYGWNIIDYEDLPNGDVLLRTSSKTVIIGDRYEGAWRTYRSEWTPDGNKHKLKSAFNDDEITHFHYIPK